MEFMVFKAFAYSLWIGSIVIVYYIDLSLHCWLDAW